MAKLNLTDRQLQFLQEEFGLTLEKIQGMTKQEWHQVREDCFDIEAAEVVDDGDDEDPDTETISEKGEIAASVADVTYKVLFAQE